MENYCVTWHLTPWSRVLTEKLIVIQLVKKFPNVYGTQRIIACHLCNENYSGYAEMCLYLCMYISEAGFIILGWNRYGH